MNKKLFCIATFAALSVSGYAFSVSAPKSYEVQYLYSGGRMNGYVQIPKGGQFGTTSEERPTFDELNINHVYYPELELTAKWDRFSVTLHEKYQYAKGKTDNLKQDLISHDIKIPQGSSMRTKHRYAYYGMRLNYDYQINPRLVMTPSIGVSMLDFSYKFSAKDKNGVSIANDDKRSFHAAMATLGVEANYLVNDKTNLIFTMNSKIPGGRIREYFDTSLLVSYNLYKKDNKELNVLGGIGYESLEFKDSQKDMQNHMKHSISPTYRVGLEYKF